MIDYVIDLNKVVKYGFGQIFLDGGTYTQHIIKGSSFFNFLFLLYAIDTRRV